MTMNPDSENPENLLPPAGVTAAPVETGPAWEPPVPAAGPGMPESPPHRVPTLSQALLLYGFIAVLFVLQAVYFALTTKGGFDSTTGTDPASLLFTQVLLLVAPTLLWTRLFRWDIVRTYRLYRVPVRVLFYTAIASLAFIPLAQEVETLVEQAMPVPPFMEEIFRQLLTAETRGELLLTVLAVAVIPGIVEEALFRGVFLWALLRHVTPRRAIFGSAFFFAFMHFNPWQFVGGLILGTIYGVIVVWTGSLLPVILAHMANNAIVVILTNVLPDVTEPTPMPWRILLDVAGVFLAILCLARIRQLGKGEAT